MSPLLHILVRHFEIIRFILAEYSFLDQYFLSDIVSESLADRIDRLFALRSMLMKARACQVGCVSQQGVWGMSLLFIIMLI